MARDKGSGTKGKARREGRRERRAGAEDGTGAGERTRDREEGTEGEARGPSRKGSDAKLYGGLGALVLALAGLVWWSLPGNHSVTANEDADSGAEGEGEPIAHDKRGRSEGGARGVFERPAQASAEFAVLTEKPDDVVRSLATVASVEKRLEARHCGKECDAVRKFMEGEDGFEIEVTTTEEIILPPKDTMDTVAVGLSPKERENARERKTAVIVRSHGRFTPEHLPARAAFAATIALAETLDGFVYDEVSRRIETLPEFREHAIVAPLAEPVFARKHVVIQLYRQEDGTARLLTLGMARFGSPDLSIREAHMSSGPLLAEVLNAAASKIAHGSNAGSLQLTLEDIARVVGKKPAELSSNPSGARPVELDVVIPERIEGDPDNDLAELVPSGGANRENWDVVVASLFGAPPSMNAPLDDKELTAVAKSARRDLAGAIKRFQAGEGELYLKGPFPIPEDARVDGGASTETLWVAVAACEAKLCTGTLSNEPSYATNLAAGKTTSVAREEALDWMLQLRDGGTAGGESIRVLKARAAR
jgi:uncharacterized protein YegJ (DUF2314 family)